MSGAKYLEMFDFGPKNNIFAVAQRAFIVGFEILKHSYLNILKNVSFRSLDLIVACSSMVLWEVNEKKREGVI